VAAFRDVPFALAKRFEPPQPAATWTGVRDAKYFGPGCKQGHPGKNPDVPVNQTEDCTRLNVFTPAGALGSVEGADDPRLLPVMVWFHGGGFKEGSSAGPFDLYDGSKLVQRHGVIVVSCNYRLGALGALVHEGGLEGNYGFLDQRACLRWVQAEIGAFGGDRTRVTAWGQSAGAQSVLLHMASNRSAGLFHRAVLESAPDLSLFTAHEARRLGAEVAKKAGCAHTSATATAECLRTIDVDALQSAASAAEASLFGELSSLSLARPTASFLPFKPHVDGTDLTEQPFAALVAGRAPAAVPTLIGFNHDEMWALMSGLPGWVGKLGVGAALSALFGLPTAVRATKHYEKLYPSDESSAALKILTDYIFTCSSQAVALALPSPSFVYQYNHIDSFGPELFGRFGLAQCASRACHEAEIPLVFGNMGPASFNISLTPDEAAISATLQAAVTAVAKGGAPVGWPPFTSAARRGLVINQTAAAVPLGEAANVCTAIWDRSGYVH